jgi:hypothetical protein
VRSAAEIFPIAEFLLEAAAPSVKAIAEMVGSDRSCARKIADPLVLNASSSTRVKCVATISVDSVILATPLLNLAERVVFVPSKNDALSLVRIKHQ